MGRNNSDEWVLQPEKLECFVSTTRMDIVDHLAGRGAMSIKELASAVGKRPSSLYHHIEKLEAAGLICESGARTVNRKHERLYATPSRRMRLKRALEDDANRDVMRRVVASLARQTERDFTRGQECRNAEPSGEERNLGFYRMVAKPGSERLRRINALLDELGELMWEEGEAEDDAVVLTWVMAPSG